MPSSLTRNSLWLCISAVACGLGDQEQVPDESISDLVGEILEMGENQQAQLRRDFRKIVSTINQIGNLLNDHID